MARWLAFVAVGLNLYRYALIFWRYWLEKGGSRCRLFLLRSPELLALLGIFGYYVWQLFYTEAGTAPSTAETTVIDFLFALYFVARVLPTNGRRRSDPARETPKEERRRDI
jgi:hypothetical protein